MTPLIFQAVAAVAVAAVISLVIMLAGMRSRLRIAEEKQRELERELGGRDSALHLTEEHLRQSQKMEAVGRLAGGVAHDFNNLLTAITGYSDFLLNDLDRGDPRRDDVREIRKAALRAANLTNQLLAFSRKQIRQPRLLEINTLLRDVEKMLGRVIGEDVRLHTSYGHLNGAVRADPVQIEQIILNLAVNARDAIDGHGEITIATAECVVTGEGAGRRAGVSAGRYAVLSVSDTGRGMDPETRDRIFEPFFTTKEVGRGTGLGLSTVYAIVEQTGGAITVTSEPGAGATFMVYLPLCDQHPESFVSGTLLPTAKGGQETILLVEDEAAVRSLAARILERHGYTVLEAENGREALAIASQHRNTIDLLLTDVVMPEVSGKQLAESLVARRPETTVLFMSGYTDGEISRHGELAAGMAFLAKPFSGQSLLAKVREVLDGRPTSVAGSDSEGATDAGNLDIA